MFPSDSEVLIPCHLIVRRNESNTFVGLEFRGRFWNTSKGDEDKEVYRIRLRSEDASCLAQYLIEKSQAPMPATR